MAAGITAEDVVRLFEEDAQARKRLAELLVPDIRLAIANTVLSKVATKQDLRELREYVDRRFDKLEEEIRELRNKLWWVVATVILGWIGTTLLQILLLLFTRH